MDGLVSISREFREHRLGLEACSYARCAQTGRRSARSSHFGDTKKTTIWESRDINVLFVREHLAKNLT